MDKESRIVFQEVDCNCNNCGHFVRDLDRLERSKQMHRNNDAKSIRRRRSNFWDEAQKELKKGNTKKVNGLLRERTRVSIDTSYRTGLIFGSCSKLNKPIETVPNVCSPSTQVCFEHRSRMVAAGGLAGLVKKVDTLDGVAAYGEQPLN